MAKKPVTYSIPPDLIVEPEFYALAPSNLWHLPSDVWEKIWDKVTGKSIKVAILDTGCNSHPDLPEPVAAESFVRGQSWKDGNGHGTHCAGTAIGRNGIGVAPEAELLVGKVLSNGGSGSSSGIAAGIRWAVDEGADVVSMSLGGGSSYGPTNTAIDYAWSKGCLVNSAAGNAGYRGANTIGWPAKYKNSICNGATRSDGSIANFSSGGREIDWATPGQSIISASHRGGYTTMSGTSMATPFGSGLLALIIELMRREGEAEWTAKEAFDTFITQYVDDRGAPGHDPRFGHGVPLYTDLVHALARGDVEFL
jgi:subtilisin family serine protease